VIGQKENGDGHPILEKSELPHLRLIFFFDGRRRYTIVKDLTKAKDVEFYVEKEYAPVAEDFGIRLK